MFNVTPKHVARPEIADSGRIRFGASCKPPVARAAVADAGRIRFGASCRRIAG